MEYVYTGNFILPTIIDIWQKSLCYYAVQLSEILFVNGLLPVMLLLLLLAVSWDAEPQSFGLSGLDSSRAAADHYPSVVE